MLHCKMSGRFTVYEIQLVVQLLLCYVLVGVSAPPASEGFSLVLIIGLAALGLLLLLLLIALIIAAIVITRRRRRSKAADEEAWTTAESVADSLDDDFATPSICLTNRDTQPVLKPEATDNVRLSVIGGGLSTGSSSSQNKGVGRKNSLIDIVNRVTRSTSRDSAGSGKSPTVASNAQLSPTFSMTNEDIQRVPKPEVTDNVRLSVIGGGLSTGSSSSPITDKDVGRKNSLMGFVNRLTRSTSRDSTGRDKIPSVSSNTQAPPLSPTSSSPNTDKDVGRKNSLVRIINRFTRSTSRVSTPGSDATVHRSPADPLPGLGPERPKPQGPNGRYVYIPPKLHREPRGWAPASHAVPAPVKRTWGRAKAKMVAQQDNQPDEL